MATKNESSRAAPSPLAVFETNMADAVWMIDLAEALANQRVKGIYSSTRDRLGDALRMSQAERAAIDVAESDDFYIIIKRNSSMTRDRLQDRTVLLRHAVVAACAATETYFADKVLEVVRPMLRTDKTASGDLPPRLRGITLSIGDLVDIDHRYTYRRRGLTETIIGPFIQERASVDPGALGEVLALAGHKGVFKAIDAELGWTKGTCEARMTAIAKRRNLIAHTGDRKGRGRSSLSSDEARSMADDLTAIVHRAELILTPVPSTTRRVDRSESVYAALTRCSGAVTAAELAELADAPRNTVATLLAKWSKDEDDDARFPHVERVDRGRYLYNP